MAKQSKQSRLEFEGISKRDELQLKNKYFEDVAGNAKNEYSYTHEDAKATGDPHGKGTGMSMGFTVPGESKLRTINRSNFVTTEDASPTGSGPGGLYDIEGYGALEGRSGRKYLQTINLYKPGNGNEYGPSSVDTTLNVADGQIVVK